MPSAPPFVDQQTPSAPAAAGGALRRVWQAGMGCPPTSLPLAFPAAVPADQAHLRAALTRCFQTFPEVRRFLAGRASLLPGTGWPD